MSRKRKAETPKEQLELDFEAMAAHWTPEERDSGVEILEQLVGRLRSRGFILGRDGILREVSVLSRGRFTFPAGDPARH